METEPKEYPNYSHGFTGKVKLSSQSHPISLTQTNPSYITILVRKPLGPFVLDCVSRFPWISIGALTNFSFVSTTEITKLPD